MLTWVVGAGGLLGKAVSRASAHTFVGAPLPWSDPVGALKVLESDLPRFATQAGWGDWGVAWVAGAGVVASSRPELQAETDIFEGFVSAIVRQHPRGHGAFFLASSAGGVYAGSSHPPFIESTTPCPLSAYGKAKLAQEELAARMLRNEVPVLVGRLSNLFGPGQDLTKAQGLVSQLCLAAARRRALNLFVPMDTLRDYLYVEDASAMIASFLTVGIQRQPDAPILRNLASGQPTSVAGVVRVVQQVARRPVPISLGTAPTSRYQVRDLRIVSRYSDAIARTPVTPLPVGVKQVYEGTLRLVADRASIPKRS